MTELAGHSEVDDQGEEILIYWSCYLMNVLC